MINVNLILYGAFRQLGVGKITLKLPSESTVADLRKSLEDYLKNSEQKISNTLVKASVFATNENILRDSDKIFSNIDLSILPPVCGG